MEKITKVHAIVKLLKKNGGKAHWSTIYAGMDSFWPGAKADTGIGQAGIRGVVNREIAKGRTFKFVDKGSGVVSLR
jgi:hypothetical protein